MKLLIEARLIPEGSTVVKKTGSKEYSIFNSVTIWSGESKQIINAENGARMITDGSGSINAVDGSTELVWIVDEETLISFLEDSREE
jgi:hypothetical protein